MEKFPKVIDGTRQIPIRFSLPSINFGEDTISAYESGCGVPYLSLLEAVQLADGAEDEPSDDPAQRIKRGKANRKAQSAAQGMLFYLHNLFTGRSRVGAVRPPINTSMVVWWRRKYAFFDEIVNEFEHELCDAAEDELYVRAVIGTDAPVIVNGEVVHITKKSDDLLKFYLTHNRPKRYSQKAEIKSTVDASLTAEVSANIKLDRSSFANLSDDELAAMEAMLIKGAGV